MPIGENVGTAYVRILADGSQLPQGIKDALESDDAEIRAQGERDAQKWQEGWEKERRSNIARFRGNVENILRTMDQTYQKGGERHGRVYLESFDMDLFRREWGDMMRGLDGDMAGFGRRHGRLYRKSLGDQLIEMGEDLTEVFDTTADRFGRLTGRGSRNDFLNFLGSFARNVTRLVLLIPELSLKVGGQMVNAFQKAGGGISGVMASMGVLSSLLTTVALGVSALVVALGVLLIALGPIIAGVSLLVGILAAMASTIGFAAVAAVAALAGALVPLAAGIAVVILGLTNLSDETKDRIESVTKSLRDNFTSLGSDVGDILTRDIGGNVKILDRTLTEMRPTILGVAEAIRTVGDEWVRMLQTPEFDRFRRTLETFLPDAVESLGRSFGNLAIAFGGIFEGSTPMLRRFLGWLERITERFAEWATSAEGQREIVRFFARAADSAKSLGGFLESVWNLLTEILDAGQGTGNNIFDKMAGAVQDWTDTLQKNPDSLKNWFKDAERLADVIGDLTEAFGELFDTLDSPENRDAIIVITDALAGLVDAVEDIGDMLSPIDSLKEDLKEIGNGPLAKGIKGIADGLSELWDSLTKFGGGRGGRSLLINIRTPNMAEVAGRFAGLATRILSRIGEINLIRNIDNPVGRIVSWFSGQGVRFLRAIGNMNLLANIDNPVTRIINWFTGLGSRILRNIGNMNLLANIANPVANIINWFTGLGSRIVSAIGDITIRPNIDWPSWDPPGNWPGGASGGFFNKPTPLVIGEAGRELLIPLDRPLHQVDPSVRDVAAFLRGKGPATGPTIDMSGSQFFSNSEDPWVVAKEFGNEIAARLA